jgi:hypothetical protein
MAVLAEGLKAGAVAGSAVEAEVLRAPCRRQPRRSFRTAVWASVLLLVTGCTCLDSFTCHDDAPPTGAVYQVVATWNNRVVVAPDPVHGGASTPGLAGRVYLFGPQVDFPLEGDGSFVVDLYDDSGAKPVLREEWRFDRETLQKLLRKDMVGWGYTVFLPWGTYKPDAQQVRLQVCYQPAKGTPLYAEGAKITLNKGSPDDVVVRTQSAPANRPQTAAELAAKAAAPPAPVGGGLEVSRFQLTR